MKNNVHGGTKGFLQAAVNLQKFMRHLHTIPTPFASPTINYLEGDFENRLCVDPKGQLKVVDRSYLFN